MKKANAKLNMRKISLICLVVLLVAGAIGFAAAKYVSNYRKEAEIHASNFHFSSNYLAYGEVPEYTVSDWGTHKVEFLLFNYQVENTALVSETDIVYRITCPEGWDVVVSDANGAEVVSVSGAYTMPVSTTRTSHKVTLSYSGQGDPSELSVKVSAERPYSMELSGKFLLNTKHGMEYEVEDKGNYNILTIRTNDYYGTVTVGWSAAHAPDNTCDYMGTWIGTTSGTLSVDEFTTYTLIFVENIDGTYDEAAFTVKEAGA